MIIVLRPDATQDQVEHIIAKVKKLGLTPHVSKGTERTIIGVIGPEDILRVTPLEVFPGVEKAMPVLAPYKLVSREFKKDNSVIDLGKGVKIGGKEIVVMAGPCAIENRDILFEIAREIKKSAKKEKRNMGLAAGIIVILMMIALLWYFGYLRF